MTDRKIDRLTVVQCNNRQEMGRVAATEVAATIKQLLAKQDAVNMVFAAAPSQNEFLASLEANDGIAWQRVHAFHMDEYVGLNADAPQRFAQFLRDRIFDRLPFGSVNLLDGSNPDAQQECQRYAQLLADYPTDIVCMGIGENCHIAFNDPHVADFNDPAMVKVVDLDLACRQQQVNDGCFPSVQNVPTHALTLTIPALMAAARVFCMVPGPTKAQAVYHTLHADISPDYPATALRQHPNAKLFIDAASAALLAL